MENQSSEPTIVELHVEEEVESIWKQNLAFGTGTIATYFPDNLTLTSRLKVGLESN